MLNRPPLEVKHKGSEFDFSKERASERERERERERPRALLPLICRVNCTSQSWANKGRLFNSHLKEFRKKIGTNRQITYSGGTQESQSSGFSGF